MPATTSIHIGLNRVDPVHYQGWDGTLKCCENDAKYYYSLAENAGFSNRVLLLSSNTDKDLMPTSINLTKLLSNLSASLVETDLLLITYSGHGGTIADQNYDEPDGQDETWCLFDRQFLDDELWQCFSRFKEGVRIWVISDSCHSGSVVRGTDDTPETSTTYLVRNAPRDVCYNTYLAYRDIYLGFTKGPIIDKADVAATVMLFGACQDNEKAAETAEYGLYTSAFKKVFENNKDIGCYQQLFDKIETEMHPYSQHPNLFSYGAGAEAFLKASIFR